MEIKDKAVVVTGGANGIGSALRRLFATEGARGVVASDIDSEGTERIAKEIGGLAVPADVSNEADVQRLVQEAEKAYGAVDLFCSNAGILPLGGPEAPNETWQKSWESNVMGHIYAARAVLPGMIARGSGYLLQTASAAGLLSEIGPLFGHQTCRRRFRRLA